MQLLTTCSTANLGFHFSLYPDGGCDGRRFQVDSIPSASNCAGTYAMFWRTLVRELVREMVKRRVVVQKSAMFAALPLASRGLCGTR